MLARRLPLSARGSLVVAVAAAVGVTTAGWWYTHRAVDPGPVLAKIRSHYRTVAAVDVTTSVGPLRSLQHITLTAGVRTQIDEAFTNGMHGYVDSNGILLYAPVRRCWTRMGGPDGLVGGPFGPVAAQVTEARRSGDGWVVTARDPRGANSVFTVKANGAIVAERISGKGLVDTRHTVAREYRTAPAIAPPSGPFC